MFEAAREQGHTFFLSEDKANPNNKSAKQFYSFKDVDEFLSVYPRTRSKWHLYEIVRQGFPCRLYLDIDHKTNEADEDKAQEAMLEIVMHFCNKLAELIDNVDNINNAPPAFAILFTKGSREIVHPKFKYKHSYHVVWPNLYFDRNNGSMKRFVAATRSTLTPTQQDMVDPIPYGKDQNFRLPYSAKWTKSGYHPQIPQMESFPLKDYLITVPPGANVNNYNTIIIGDKEVDALYRPIRSSEKSGGGGGGGIAGMTTTRTSSTTTSSGKSKTIPITKFFKTQSGGDDTPLLHKQLNTMIAACGDRTSRIVKELKAHDGIRIFQGSNLGCARTCPAGSIHHSNNFYLTCDTCGQVKYHCFGNKPCAHVPVVIGLLNSKDEFTIDPTEISHYQIYDQRYAQNFKANTRCLMVKSDMGSGKTTRAKETLGEQTYNTINNLRPKWHFLRGEGVDKYKRILIVGTRIAFDKTMLGAFKGFGFQLYQDVNDDIGQVDRLVIQYESLHRLYQTDDDGNTFIAPYDYVILDELESLCKNMTSKTNKTNIALNKQVFESVLMPPSTQILALDADLSNRGVRCMKSIIGGENISLHINEARTLRRNIDLYGQDCQSKLDWLDDIKRDLLAGRKLMIASGSKNVLKYNIEPFLEQNGISCRFYHSDCSDQILKDFEDPEASWQQYQCVMFTAKLTVGVDFSTPDYFDRIYSYCCSSTCTPSTMLQMCGRCRYPKNTTIRMFIDQHMHAEFRCSKGKVQHERKTRKLMTDKIMSRVFTGKDVYNSQTNRIEFNLNETWLTDVYDFNELETRRAFENYRSELIRAATLKGYRIFIRPDQDVPEGPKPVGTDNSIALTQDEINHIKVAEFDEAPLLDQQEAAVIEGKKARVIATAAEKMALKKYTYCNLFGPVDGWHYIVVEPRLQQVFNTALTLRMDPRKAHNYDRLRFSGQYESLARPRAPRLQLIIELSKLLGLSGPLDTSTTVASERIDAVKHRIWTKRKEFDTLFKLRMSSQPDTTGTYTFNQTIRLINSVYNVWCCMGFKKMAQTRKRKRGEKGSRQIQYVLTAHSFGFDSHTLNILEVAEQLNVCRT